MYVREILATESGTKFTALNVLSIMRTEGLIEQIMGLSNNSREIDILDVVLDYFCDNNN